ncbi:tetratricopeptide repeat protein [Actinomadura livida]|nr:MULTISPECIES: tetratricopeptide repeat protein [Actinomadura]MBB4772880.1 tetratricopeptide (TPR) repeat protein [Actinomadura catellatispora]
MARQLLRADGLERGSVANLARQIYDWEKGRNFPRDWAPAYAKAFKLDPSELFSTGVVKEASSPYEPDHDDEEDEVKRRALLGLLATTAVAAPLGRDAEHLRATLTGTLTTEATERDADTWERVVHDYAHEAGYLPPAQVLPEMLADLAELDLLISRATDAVRPKLVHAAGYLSAFTAISLIGLGDLRASRRWWRTAIRAGDESGDPLLASYARGRQAVLSLCDKHSEQSVLDLAEEAITISRGTPSAAQASAHATRAQALAQMGRHAEAYEALDDLRQVFERLPDHVRTDQGSQFGWSIQRLHHTAGFVYTHTGDHSRARQAQDEALASYTSKSVLGPAQVEMYRATTLIQEGDADAGAKHVVNVLEQLPTAHRKTHTVRKNAITALSKAPPKDARRPAVRDAYAMLASTAST